MPTFDSLWIDLEPLIKDKGHVKAKAILAVAFGYVEERDNPTFHDKLRRDRTLAAEALLENLPTPEDIAASAAEIRDGWTTMDERTPQRIAPRAPS